MTLKISAIVCTYNQAAMVRGALESLLKQSLPPNQYEVVVVDNASTDETKTLVNQYSRYQVPVRYIYEPNLGLSHARNRGAKEAHSEILVFMDDDVLVDEYCLAEHYHTYELHPSVIAVGGRIELLWLAPRPSWLPSSLENYFSKFNLGQEPKELNFPSAPFGANFSVRRAAFQETGGFSTLLGRKGKNLLSGEEYEFFHRLSLLGSKVMYQPKALVWHKVPAARISRSWLSKRIFAGGVTSAIIAEMAGSNPNRLRCLIRGLKTGLKGILYSLRMPVAAIISGENNSARINTTIHLFGLAYQSIRMAVGLEGG